MLRQRLLGVAFFIFFMMGCSAIVNKNNVTLPLNKKYAIGSFWNYTETPMAGLRASTIVESVLSKKNISLISLIGGSDEMELSKSKLTLLNETKEQAKQLGVDYLIVGNVQEWRYKTGIDGEPVVSYSIRVIDLESERVLFNGVGAKSGWGHKSIGVVAQEIAENLIPKFVD